MKKQILMTAFGLLMTVLTAVAGDKYLVNVSGTCRTVSPADRIVTRPFTTPTILRSCANDTNSPSDVRQLRLLYDVDTDAIAVSKPEDIRSGIDDLRDALKKRPDSEVIKSALKIV